MRIDIYEISSRSKCVECLTKSPAVKVEFRRLAKSFFLCQKCFEELLEEFIYLPGAAKVVGKVFSN